MTTMHVSREAWALNLKGFEITGIAIRDRDILQLVARQAMPHDQASLLMNSEIPTRIYSVFLDDFSPQNIEHQELHNMPYPKLGVSRAPFERPGGLVSAGRCGDTWPLGGGNGPMEQIAAEGRAFSQRLKCIFGFTYSMGVGRKLYKREAVGRWVRIGDFPTPTDMDGMERAGFEDLDAFSESDLYAVGGHGDVWHYDGSDWRQMDFPAKEQLATVTCAGDGNVYITSEGGSLWVGQHSTWRLLEKRGSSILWNDVRWFNGQLWLASDYQLRVWNGKEVDVVEHDGQAILATGHMDVHDGLLAIADLWSVSTFDGQTWRKVVAPYKD